MRNILFLFLLMLFVNACKPPSPMDKPLGNSVNNPKECSDFKNSSDCLTSPLRTKKCYWSANICYEQVMSNIVIRNGGIKVTVTEVYGLAHGSNANWGALCNEDPNEKAYKKNINSLGFDFKVNQDESTPSKVEIKLTCKNIANPISYEMEYAAIPKPDGSLKIRLFSNQVVNAVADNDNKDSNQLNFFTKGDWFFYFDSANKQKFSGCVQLGNVFTTDPVINIDTATDIENAINYQKSNPADNNYDDHYDIPGGIQAISFVF